MTSARSKTCRFCSPRVVLLILSSFLPLTSHTSAEEIQPRIENSNSLLHTALTLTRFLLGGCLRKVEAVGHEDSEGGVAECLGKRSLVALERAVTMDRLQIHEGIELVKKGNWTGNESRNSSTSWSEEVAKKLNTLFKTHLLKFRVKPGKFLVDARGRHRHKDMMPIVMFAVLAISMIAIPMGFQFLAVLGGKALLLAKLALILTSIQGLKKIATSNLNYGLYQVPQTYPWHGYDRRLQYEMAGEPNKYQGYNQQDSVMDLLHPLSPRSTSGYDRME